MHFTLPWPIILILWWVIRSVDLCSVIFAIAHTNEAPCYLSQSLSHFSLVLVLLLYTWLVLMGWSSTFWIPSKPRLQLHSPACLEIYVHIMCMLELRAVGEIWQRIIPPLGMTRVTKLRTKKSSFEVFGSSSCSRSPSGKIYEAVSTRSFDHFRWVPRWPRRCSPAPL